MKLAICFLTIFCFSLFAKEIQERSQNRTIESPIYYWKAGSFIDANEHDRVIYAMGMMDGFHGSALFGASDETVDALKSCTRDMDSKQISAIIEKYLRDHPETWHLPLSVETFNALQASCPGIIKVIRPNR